jgi:hypothetical protein
MSFLRLAITKCEATPTSKAYCTRHPGMGCRHNFKHPFSPEAASAWASFSSSALNGCWFFHSGCCGAMALTRSNAKASWKINRLLGPQCAVIVENGDTLGRRHKIHSVLLGDARDKVRNGVLGGSSIIPGWQRLGARSLVNSPCQTPAGVCGETAVLCSRKVNADGHQVSVVAPVKEPFAWRLLHVALEERQKIETIEMHLEGFCVQRVTVFEFFDQVRFRRLPAVKRKRLNVFARATDALAFEIRQ